MKDVIMKKKLLFPTLCLGVGKGNGCKTLEVDIEVRKRTFTDYETRQEVIGYEFSACGSGLGHGGQCLDYFKDKAEQYMIDESRRELFNRVFTIWDEYHLNSMIAGTKKQEECLKEYKAKNRYDYKEACKYLEEHGLLEDNGYRYGTSWLGKQIPTEIMDEVFSWENIENFTKEELSVIRRKLIREYIKNNKSN